MMKRFLFCLTLIAAFLPTASAIGLYPSDRSFSAFNQALHSTSVLMDAAAEKVGKAINNIATRISDKATDMFVAEAKNTPLSTAASTLIIAETFFVPLYLLQGGIISTAACLIGSFSVCAITGSIAEQFPKTTFATIGLATFASAAYTAYGIATAK